MKSRYRMFAGYNAWCNERLYAAAATLTDADYRADRGAFFKSVHGTLNHLLDRRSHLDAALHRRQANCRRALTLSCTTISRRCGLRAATKTR